VKSKHDMNISGDLPQTARAGFPIAELYSAASNVSVFRPTLFASTQEFAVFHRARPTPKPLLQEKLAGTLYLALRTPPEPMPPVRHAKIVGLLGMKLLERSLGDRSKKTQFKLSSILSAHATITQS
jgi:hypothetical protein